MQQHQPLQPNCPSPEPRTLKTYDKIGPILAARYELAERSRIQQVMARHFGPGYEVLELGCGSGADAAALLQRGVDIHPTDGSASMLNEAAKLHPELAEKLKHIVLPCQLPYEDGYFRGVVATTVLMHFSPQALKLLAAEIARVLRPGGSFYVTVSPERAGLDSDGFDSDGRFFNRLRIEEIAEIFRENLLYLDSFENVPDALGRTDVVIQEGVFRRSSQKLPRSTPKPPPVLIEWSDVRITATLPRSPEDYPPLEDELLKQSPSEREVDRARISSELDAILVPTLGCFTPGYSLAVPTKELLSFAEVAPEDLASFEPSLERWRSILGKVMGEVVIAEHGSSASCAVTAACVSQAHLHLIPLAGLTEKIRERYHEEGGEPDATFSDLADLPDAAGGDPYVLLSTEPKRYEIWSNMNLFRRQFVRRQAADLLGISYLYNWRNNPFVEQLELTVSLLKPLYAQIAKEGGIDTTDRLRWLTPYDQAGLDDHRQLNPHISLFEELNVEKLLFLASCRASGIAEESLHRLCSLQKTDNLAPRDQLRAEAAAVGVIRARFDTCCSGAAISLLKELGWSEEALSQFYDMQYVDSAPVD